MMLQRSHAVIQICTQIHKCYGPCRAVLTVQRVHMPRADLALKLNDRRKGVRGLIVLDHFRHGNPCLVTSVI